ncbi:hypothetical protein SAMN05421821_10880 [Mucilaginibacter lappiensis]|uniref:Uncharacterized protein n=1 Tax=Mucilaginibacter lappiensis TaxID=354630 RepID=A0ABR6PKH5_9SPHI|nr:hypothetical protein [Mucilaginibacter lappiensis]SIR52683.1 hypothetical protein SAMN05421821_10880 [Mucilaginibacter lappiensis]
MVTLGQQELQLQNAKAKITEIVKPTKDFNV